MDKQIVSAFRFDNYRVDSIEFKFNDNFTNQESIDIDFGVGVELALHETEQKGKVTLHARIFPDAKDKNYPFTLEVSVTGLFSAETTFSKEELGKFIEINGTTALFPFLRSVVADITRAANTDPLILPLMNIHNLIKQQKEQLLLNQ
jgi:preprotein translocase subunit SecB